ncbi:CHC2 zinc finger domain-containing protein [Azospirillum argentinense]
MTTVRKIDIEKIDIEVFRRGVLGRAADILTHEYHVQLSRPNAQGRCRACCPLHRETTASFYLWANGRWKCFGCNTQGDVFDFMDLAEGLLPGTAFRRELAATARHKAPVRMRTTIAMPPAPALDKGILAAAPGPERLMLPRSRQTVQVYTPGREPGRMHLTVDSLHPYTTLDGRRVGYVARARQGKASSKSVFPLVWRENFEIAAGQRITAGWVAERPAEMEMVYGLDRIGERRRALLTEGEKCADAGIASADRIGATSLSWIGGGHMANRIDLEPLRGRIDEAILWPDADQSGYEAMAILGGRLVDMGVSVRCAVPPPDAPKGWDLADALHPKPDDPPAWHTPWTLNQVEDLIGGAIDLAAFVTLALANGGAKWALSQI